MPFLNSTRGSDYTERYSEVTWRIGFRCFDIFDLNNASFPTETLGPLLYVAAELKGSGAVMTSHSMDCGWLTARKVHAFDRITDWQAAMIGGHGHQAVEPLYHSSWMLPSRKYLLLTTLPIIGRRQGTRLSMAQVASTSVRSWCPDLRSSRCARSCHAADLVTHMESNWTGASFLSPTSLPSWWHSYSARIESCNSLYAGFVKQIQWVDAAARLVHGVWRLPCRSRELGFLCRVEFSINCLWLMKWSSTVWCRDSCESVSSLQRCEGVQRHVEYVVPYSRLSFGHEVLSQLDRMN